MFLLSYISLNGADLETLRRIFPGSLADSVYKYRELRGEFESIYELRNVPGITDEIFAKVKDSLVLYSSEEMDTSDVGERIVSIINFTTREESPSDLAREYWITLGGVPLNPNDADIMDLRNIYGVSLKDASSVVKWRKITTINSLRDLRSTPGLSYYGYRNLSRFVSFRKDNRPFRGFISFYAYSSNYAYDPSSYLGSTITDLMDTSGNSRNLNLLREGGWSDESISKLLTRLNDEANDIKTEPKPFYSLRGTFRIYDKFGFGFYRGEGYSVYNKAYLSYDSRNLKVLAGNYRFSFGNGLIFESSESMGDRVYEKVWGIMPDVTYGDEFGLKGVGIWGRFNGLYPFFIYSKDRKDAVVDTAGRPLFYYSSDLKPKIFKDVIGEKLFGGGMKYLNENGYGIGFMYFQIEYDKPFSGDWGSLAIPYYSYTYNNGWPYDESFYIDTGRIWRFAGLTYSAIIKDLEISGDIAGSIKDFKPSYLLIMRWTKYGKSVDLVYRNYAINYINPYARPFKEDNRFERTDFRYSYRLLDPLATNIADIPIPKPEEGIFVQIRDRIFSNLLVPRIYLDYWKDKTDGQTNKIFHAEVEWRILWALRLRLSRRYIDRTDIRYGYAYKSKTFENTLRFFLITDANGIASIEVRHANFKSGNMNPVSGVFLNVFYEFPLNRGTNISMGANTWTTEGYSLWVFEDDGIDFLYNRGGKMYISLSKSILNNAYLRLKLRYKKQINDGNAVLSATGDPISAGVGRYEYFTTYLSVYIAF